MNGAGSAAELDGAAGAELNGAAEAEPLVVAPDVAEFLMGMRVSLRRCCEITRCSRVVHCAPLLAGTAGPVPQPR